MFCPDNFKILVVDDSEESLNLIKSVFTKKGFNSILLATSAKEAKAILLTEHNSGKSINLILSDWEMPEVNGKELLEFTKSNDNFAKIPFILVTANADFDYVFEAMDLGVTSYILKPINFDMVIEKINTLITQLNK